MPEQVVIAAAHYHTAHRVAPTIAHECGFFAEAGLENYQVITTDHNEQNFYRALKEGAVHIGLDCKPRDFLRYRREMDLPMLYIAGWRNQSPFVFFAAPGINSAQDLKGKRIAVRDLEGVDAVQARYWLRGAGLDPDRDVEWVRGPYSYGLGIEAIRRGEVECAPVPDEQAVKVEQQGFIPIARLGKEAYPDGYPERGVATTPRFLEEHSDIVLAFLKGLIRAYRVIRDQPLNLDYLNQLMAGMRKQPYEDAEERALQITQTARDWARHPYPPDGRFPTKGLQTVIDQEHAAGRLTEPLDAPTLADNTLAQQANSELNARPELREQFERCCKWVEEFGY